MDLDGFAVGWVIGYILAPLFLIALLEGWFWVRRAISWVRG